MAWFLRSRAWGSRTCAFACALTLLACPQPAAAAARRVRPLFEPTDLELETPGVLEGDLQFGVAKDDALRVIVPDFELDLGVLPFLELDIDGAYAVEGKSRGPFSFDHAAPDSLWPAAKVGIYDARNPEQKTALALGAQLGPKLPVAVAAHGVGVEGLLMLATTFSSMQLVWNTGAFIDPAPDAHTDRPRGLELGVDAEVAPLTLAPVSIIGSLSAVHFLSADDDQLVATAGADWSVLADLDLSLVALVGFLSGGDRYGLLLGVAPKFHLFD